MFGVGCSCAWGAWASCLMWMGLGAEVRCGVCGSWRAQEWARVARMWGVKTLLRKMEVVACGEEGSSFGGVVEG